MVRLVFNGLLLTIAAVPVAKGSKWLGGPAAIASLGGLGGQALAVMEPAGNGPAPQGEVSSREKTPAYTTPEEIPATGVAPLRLDIPVSWQMTRARLYGSGASTLTESFRETWTLEHRLGGMSFLTSPRGKVRVYVAGVRLSSAAEAAQTPVAIETIVVPERDFALLIGISVPPAGIDGDVEPADGTGELVTLNLTHRQGTDVSLNLSEEEHFAVHLELGTSTATF